MDDFVGLIGSFAEEDLLVAPGRGDEETAWNTRWIGVPEGGVDAEEVCGALVRLGEVLRVRFAAVEPPLTFYGWHDRQAGQLRLSLRSVGPHRLPFGRPYRVCVDPAEVAASVAADVAPGLVEWYELEPADAVEEESEAEEATFAVYVVPLGGRTP
ncbi:hypothetical protein [Rhizohabitans arisaemae]|uniref:hypothetical protein n=1 Tax=Rhizohabitans arisaemae TaxID=2720610 RepID=UPI0024B0E0B3|nr:hypothetical protein [Rhizohabitans arisaemae]